MHALGWNKLGVSLAERDSDSSSASSSRWARSFCSSKRNIVMAGPRQTAPGHGGSARWSPAGGRAGRSPSQVAARQRVKGRPKPTSGRSRAL